MLPPRAPAAMKPLVLSAVLLSTLTLAVVLPGPAAACAEPPCEPLNRLCAKVFGGGGCIPAQEDESAAAPALRACAGEVCDAINRVCMRLGGAPCVGFAAAGPGPAADAFRCSGGICDTINKVCGNCLPALAASQVDCMGPVCDQINAVCYRVGGAYCLG